MQDMTRQALFALGLLLLFLAILFELGSVALLGRAATSAGLTDMPRPGLGIRAGAIVDLVLLYSLAILAADFIGPLRAVIGRVQGIVTFVLALTGFFASVAMIYAAIAALILMVAFLLAVPFGTMIYMFTWSQFDTTSARTLLALVMNLKLAGLLLLWLSNPMLIKNKGFVLLVASSLVVNFVLGFLIAWPPGFLASITDAIGAIIAGIVAAVWMVIFLIGAVPAVAKALRSLVPKPV
ncbi:hypothetical protein [Bradyrhizobium sp. SZCCHNS3051]|uniref:hypothetical protein n=1 Tax=Bradyrhizobium sp. SZCCHNS3051 TaxID=3057320 RepID=UPI002915E08B|nr:hypothetical protein [Bradyrhizobium sp. SZCCHNS3051]